MGRILEFFLHLGFNFLFINFRVIFFLLLDHFFLYLFYLLRFLLLRYLLFDSFRVFRRIFLFLFPDFGLNFPLNFVSQGNGFFFLLQLFFLDLLVCFFFNFDDRFRGIFYLLLLDNFLHLLLLLFGFRKRLFFLLLGGLLGYFLGTFRRVFLSNFYYKVTGNVRKNFFAVTLCPFVRYWPPVGRFFPKTVPLLR